MIYCDRFNLVGEIPMTKTLRKRLMLLGTTSLFAVALVAAPVQFSSVTPDLAVAHAAGNSGGSDNGDAASGRDNTGVDAGGGGDGSAAGGSGSGSGPGGNGGGGGPPS